MSSVSQAALEKIALLNADPSISGILVLHPMSGFTPEEERRVFDAVDRHKDIDGMNSAMIGLLALKEPGYIPCAHSVFIALENVMPRQLLSIADPLVRMRRLFVAMAPPIFGKMIVPGG